MGGQRMLVGEDCFSCFFNDKSTSTALHPHTPVTVYFGPTLAEKWQKSADSAKSKSSADRQAMSVAQLTERGDRVIQAVPPSR